MVASAAPILIPQITYRTNDSWELVSAIAGDNGWPILQDADYLHGHLQVLTIPENFADLSNYPEPVLNRPAPCDHHSAAVKLEAPGNLSLFVYDNGTFIVHNFRDEPVNASVSLVAGVTGISDLVTGEKVAAAERKDLLRFGAPPVLSSAASFAVAPHSFRAFKIN